MQAKKHYWLWALAVIAVCYLLLAYVVAPHAWKRVTSIHPSVHDVPNVTLGADGLPGDPVNLTIHGDEATLRAAMAEAGWTVADPLGLRDDARIVLDTLAHRGYSSAPVSKLYLFGRIEDIAFEMPIGADPSRRHHVRFWRSGASEPFRWLGAATLDKSVGLAHTTGQITHHIGADVDKERDHVLASLDDSGRVLRRWYVADFHKERNGKNAGGDLWRTDGRLGAARLRPD
ncbi:MAG: LssY C-terminal domain-containing protein [Pseudoxanthomonas sp.]|nr:LssY C-terminal domain-containing protein [Pseudoxanthomonas sp.]